MKYKISILIFAIILVFTFGIFEQVLACSCFEKETVCGAFGESKVVFVGTVLKGNSPERLSETIRTDRDKNFFPLKVIEAFAGTEKDQVIPIYTGTGFGDCGFPFKEGETYLIYAYERNGKLNTNICTRSSHISRKDFNKEDFDFLRNLSKKEEGGIVNGKVTIFAKSSFDEDSIQPFSDVKLKLERTNLKQKPIEIKTNKLGHYKFRFLPTGSYKITPIIPDHFEVDDYEVDEFWLNNKGCSTQDISVEYGNYTSVKVIDSEGKPVSDVYVEFVPLHIDYEPKKYDNYGKEFGSTEKSGTASFFDLAPGKYTISINLFRPPEIKTPFPTTFYPNVTDRTKSQVIEIKPGMELEQLTLQIPYRLAEKKISGKVFWDNGKPAANAYFFIRDISFPDQYFDDFDLETDENGKYSFIALQGRKYLIKARVEIKRGDELEFYEGITELSVNDEDLNDVKIIISSEKSN